MSINLLGIAVVMVTSVTASWYMYLSPGKPTLQDGRPMVEVSVLDLSGDAAQGEHFFVANCAECHGLNAAGKEGLAPPLVHKIYRPGHHGDITFELAGLIGVRSHHWPFGSMPPVEGLGKPELKQITAYVRALKGKMG